MKRLVTYLFVIASNMGYTQLNENILYEDFEMIQNVDFKLVLENDYDNRDIEYKSDYYYKPDMKPSLTFLGYPISIASFYLTDDEKIKGFGMKVQTDNAILFYHKVVEAYGSFSVSSPSTFFFEKHGISLPKEYSEESNSIVKNFPIPIVEEYKDMRTISWYFNIKKSFARNGITMKIYNHPKDGKSFESLGRELRIVFSLDDIEN